MTVPIEAALEDAVIARIKSAQGLGYKLATVESYGGQLDDLEMAVRAFPAVYVTLAGGGKPKALGAEKWYCPLLLTVFVGSRNVRGERETRHGATGAVGSYQMRTDVRDLLIGQDLALEIEALKPGQQRTLFNVKLQHAAVSVLAQEFHTAFVWKKPDPAEVNYLLAVGINYHLQPDDGTADAIDIVNLGG